MASCKALCWGLDCKSVCLLWLVRMFWHSQLKFFLFCIFRWHFTLTFWTYRFNIYLFMPENYQFFGARLSIISKEKSELLKHDWNLICLTLDIVWTAPPCGQTWYNKWHVVYNLKTSGDLANPPLPQINTFNKNNICWKHVNEHL